MIYFGEAQLENNLLVYTSQIKTYGFILMKYFRMKKESSYGIYHYRIYDCWV
jgi:hypothetical protein